MADEDKRQHLDLLQSTIARMAGYSFLLKGWSVTLSAALIGLSAKDSRPRVALLALLPIMAFWGLDAYYLGLERRFRDLFGKAIGAGSPTDFEMTPGKVGVRGWLDAVVSPAVALLHLPLALAALGVYWWLR